MMTMWDFYDMQEFGDDPTVSDEASADGSRVSSILKTDKDADMMSLTIREGRLEGRFRSSSTEVVSITSSDSFNDGLFHSIAVVRSGRKVEVLVDDTSIGVIRLARQPAPLNPGGLDPYHLMLGGVRSEWLSTVADFIGIQHSFTGCIADLSFNNQ